jgi:hypothetical protein
MSKYECPNCDGGFPEPLDKQCPWCGQDMNKSYTDGPKTGAFDPAASSLEAELVGSTISEGEEIGASNIRLTRTNE